MTTPAGRGGNGVTAASGVAELGAEALGAGTGLLTMKARLVCMVIAGDSLPTRHE